MLFQSFVKVNERERESKKAKNASSAFLKTTVFSRFF